jgi:hypothetical protein
MNDVGVVYDRNEVSRMDAFLKSQNELMQQADKGKELQNQNVLKYAVLLGGIVITLVFFKIMVNKKK